ncbi:MAG: Gfo/Idh/MocA family protein, partial [Chloroflexota bacterium]
MEGSLGATDPVEPVRVGLIGAGLSASLHLAAMRRSHYLEPVAIGARRSERAASAAIEAGIPLHSDDYKSICRHPDVEAVVIATPPHLHHPIAIAALEEGKHVLCEKPMARNVAEARDMLRIADRVEVVAMLNLQQRYLPERMAIKRLIESGFVGEPQAAMIHVTLSSLNDPMDRPWGWLMEAEKAGGMLGATGTQYIDALHWWFGEVSAVAGTLSTMVKQRRLPDGSGMGKVDADDNFAVILRFPSGMLATLHVSATSGFDGGEEIIISGSR